MREYQIKFSQLARALPVRTDLHLTRKIWHMFTGLAIISCYMAGMSQTMALTILGALFLWSIAMETTRLRNPALNEKCVRFFSGVIRSHEVNRVSGMPYYLASSIIAIAIFPKPVAILALFYLALGDPLASLFGILYSHRSVKIFNSNKSLHGTAAGYVVCALTTLLYLQSTGMHGLDLIRLTLLGGFAGALAELLPLDLDDNFTIPVVSGFILWMGFIAIQFIN
jgi:diacylglycerol kinase (CTP)